jgi:hypothetical protein
MTMSNAQAVKAAEEYSKQEEELEREKERINSQSQAEDDSTQAEGEKAPESESATDKDTPADETETKTPEADGQKEQETETDTDDQEQVSAPKTSRKAENRYRSLAERTKKAEEEARRANELLRQYVYGQGQPTPPSQAPVEQTTSEDGYLTMDEVIRNVQDTTRQTIQQEREQEKNEQRWEKWREDAAYLEEKYPVFNGKHKEYDDELVQDILEEYKGRYSTNRDLRLKDVAEKRIKQAERLAEKLKAQAADLIRKQASEQAIGSGEGPTPTKQSVEQMIKNVRTEEDLEALKTQIGVFEH